MALVDLKTKYKDLKWQYDGEVPHGNPKANTIGKGKPRFTNEKQQNLFYQNNIGRLLGPLQSLTTQYKTKPFGSDKLGGGWSGEPFITFNMDGDASWIAKNTRQVRVAGTNPGTNVNSQVNTISTDGTSQIDYPIRGGNYPSRDIDYERIKAFLDSDKGLLFIEKQKTLQFMNPKMETGLNVADPKSAANNLGANVLENTRVYSVRNTLDQVAFQGTGIHVSRVGNPYLNITALSSKYGSYINYNDQFYGDIVGRQNIENSYATNRLEILRRLKVLDPNTISKNTSTSFISKAQFYLYARKLGIATNIALADDGNRGVLFDYPGGPNYSSKFGSTVIRRAVDTTQQPTTPTNPNKVITSATAMKYNQLAAVSGSISDPIDFRTYTERYDPTLKNVNNKSANVSGSIIWNKNKTFEWRLKTSVVNEKPNKTEFTTFIKQDMLNMRDIVNSTNEDPYTNKNNPKDFIKFGFECVDNQNPNNSIVLLFRAFLSNGFTDNNTAQLTPYRYFGRGEEFFTYGGFSRSIQFSFKVVVKSRVELKPLYNKLNALISQVYPDYSNQGVMRAPLIKLTIGDYLYRVPGFIDSINVTADNNTPWEINLEGSEEVQQLPHVLEVQVGFKPIHAILPKRRTNSSGRSNLITNDFTT